MMTIFNSQVINAKSIHDNNNSDNKNLINHHNHYYLNKFMQLKNRNFKQRSARDLNDEIYFKHKILHKTKRTKLSSTSSSISSSKFYKTSNPQKNTTTTAATTITKKFNSTVVSAVAAAAADATKQQQSLSSSSSALYNPNSHHYNQYSSRIMPEVAALTTFTNVNKNNNTSNSNSISNNIINNNKSSNDVMLSTVFNKNSSSNLFYLTSSPSLTINSSFSLTPGHHNLFTGENGGNNVANATTTTIITTTKTTTPTTTHTNRNIIGSGGGGGGVTTTAIITNGKRPTIIIYPTVSPESIVIPIVSCILGFPLLALLVICCLRRRAKLARERDRRRNYDMQDHAVSLVRFSPIHRLNNRSSRVISLRPERSLSRGFPSLELDTVVEERSSDHEQTQTDILSPDSPLDPQKYRGFNSS